MYSNFKKIFSFLFKNKKIFLLFLFFIFFGFFIFLKPGLARADAGTIIASAFFGVISFLPSVLLIALFVLFLPLSIIILEFSAGILRLVISPDFLKGISYTNPADNPVINAGLSITQSFANIFLVLVLVFIALTTILRLAGYETKKLLLTFIIVALLVNFAPLICGLVIDASNIMMNFFLKKIGSFGVSIENLRILTNTFLEETMSIGKVINFPAHLAFSLFAVLSLNFVFTFIFGIFAVIFILRPIAIWILVILSPLAFVCYILPNTKQWAKKWWEQLIQWSIIGITTGFFLYLSQKVVVPTPNFKGTGSIFLPYLMPLAFLFLALIFGLQTSAMGASSIISGSKKVGKWAGKWAGRQSLGRFLATKSGDKTTKTMSKAPTIGEAFRMQAPGIKGKLKKGAAIIGGLTGTNWALRTAGSYGARYGASSQRTVEGEKKKITEMFGKDYKKAAQTYGAIPITEYQKKIALAQYLTETKGGKAFGELNKEQQYEAIKLTARYGRPDQVEDLIKSDPILVEKDDRIKAIAEKVNPRFTNIKGIIKEMKPDDYKNITKESIDGQTEESIKIIDAMLDSAMGKHISQLIEGHGRIAAQSLEERIDAGAYINPRLVQFLDSDAGKGLISPKLERDKWKTTLGYSTTITPPPSPGSTPTSPTSPGPTPKGPRTTRRGPGGTPGPTPGGAAGLPPRTTKRGPGGTPGPIPGVASSKTPRTYRRFTP